MKRMILLALALLLAVSPALAEGEISVLATTYPLYDMAKNIGGEDVTVTYDPEAAGDAQGADIVVCAGNEAEEWNVENVVKASDDALAFIEGDYEVSTIPINMAMVATTLDRVLGEMNPEHQTAYNDNFSAYADAMFALDAEIREAVAEGATVTGADGSMAYFAQEYGATEAEGGVELHTYTHPEEADQETPYIDLMRRNLEALQAAK